MFIYPPLSAILESTEVKELLHIMLVVGNFINTGGYAGNAAGFYKFLNLNNVTTLE